MCFPHDRTTTRTQPSSARAQQFIVTAAASFDQLIAEYVASHPKYQYPANGDRHPAILAQVCDIKTWLIARLGGFEKYLTALIDAARIWFPPGCRGREFRIFCYMFEGSANVGWGNFPEMRPYSDRYCSWAIGIRYSLRTLVTRLRETQEENFAQDFAHLVQMSKERFLPAARLVGMNSSEIERLERLGQDARIDVHALRDPASGLWQRCVDEYNHPQQGELFEGWPDPPAKLWDKYFYEELAPTLVGDDEVVRLVLQTVGVLPLGPLRPAALALRARFLEISLPGLPR